MMESWNLVWISAEDEVLQLQKSAKQTLSLESAALKVSSAGWMLEPRSSFSGRFSEEECVLTSAAS